MKKGFGTSLLPEVVLIFSIKPISSIVSFNLRKLRPPIVNWSHLLFKMFNLELSALRTVAAQTLKNNLYLYYLTLCILLWRKRLALILHNLAYLVGKNHKH